MPASAVGPAARGKSHREEAEAAEAVTPTLVWPSMLGETDLLELEEMDQRSCIGSQHHLVKGDSGFCPVFNCRAARLSLNCTIYLT